MKTKLFIDFDDTLFDRNRFKKDLLKIFDDLGFSEEEKEESYRAVYHDGYDGIEAQLQYLNQNVREFNLTDALDKAWIFLKDLKRYLFPEAIQFLESIDHEQYDVHLLTVGGIDFQKTKVRNSGIEEMIGEEKCHYTVEDKDEALAHLIREGESFMLIEDKDATIKKVGEAFPGAKMIKAEGGKLLELGRANAIIVDEIDCENDPALKSHI